MMNKIDQDDERLKELFFSLKMFIIELNKLVITCVQICPPRSCHIISGQRYITKIDFEMG